ncbi:MAG: F0F1 ATP synthase subunit alpha [Chloroflexi bacterium]|nr:F0F1 ATP synthase subunit alpha [Chloroflexota bacterium]
MRDLQTSLKILTRSFENLFSGEEKKTATAAHRRRKSVFRSAGWIESRSHNIRSSKSNHPEIEKLLTTIQQGFRKSPQDNVIIQSVGTVQHIGNGVAHISGLPYTGIDELVIFENGVEGLTLNLGMDRIDVILLGVDEGIHGGDLVLSMDKRLTFPVGSGALGRILDPLGKALDEKADFEAVQHLPIERRAPGIIERATIDTPLYTGTKKIDALIPIGRGQRELIAGDRQTGKTTLAIDTILNQKDQDVICIYVAIGQKKSSLLPTLRLLGQRGAMKYTTVISASPDDPPALRYIAPFAGCTLAEYFAGLGKDVLIIYDDLSKHADAYREISLLLKRPPGREAYPGDIFYLHSRLLERSGKWNEDVGGGSITAMPIVNLQQGNVASYIPTNLISICDGQIILDSDLFNRSVFPAINIDLSVSRVGGAAQIPAIREIASQLKLEIAQFGEIEKFAQFGSEIDEETRARIERGKIIQAAFSQNAHQPYSSSEEFLFLYALASGILFEIPDGQITDFENRLFIKLHASPPDFVNYLSKDSILCDENRIELDEFIRSVISVDQLEGK